MLERLVRLKKEFKQQREINWLARRREALREQASSDDWDGLIPF
jgi:hypothetical protein